MKPAISPFLVLALCLSVVLVSFSYIWKIDYFPAYKGDEVSFLLIPYRLVLFDDLRYPLTFAESYNDDVWRKYPPVPALLLTSLIHKLFGFSAHLGRLITVVFALVTISVPVWLSTRAGRSLWIAPAGILFLGGLPAVFTAARSPRLEQEIVLLGSISVLAALFPLLRPPTVSNRWGPHLLVLSGFGAGWAGSSHPWGLCFAVVLLCTLIWHGPAWQALYGRSWKQLAGFFVGGMAIPSVFTAWTLLHDWPELKNYSSVMGRFYAVRGKQLNDHVFQNSALFIKDDLRQSIVVNYEVLKRNAFAVSNLQPGDTLVASLEPVFNILFWLAFCVSIAIVCRLRSRTIDSPRLPEFVFAALGLGFIAIALTYPGNNNYYLYTGYFPMAAVFLATAAAGHKVRARVGAGAALLGIVFLLTVVAFLGRSVTNRTRLPLDVRLSALRSLSEVGPAGPAYCETLTWIACQRNPQSVLDALGGRQGPEPALVAVDRRALNFFLGFYPALADPTATTEEKASRWLRLIEHLSPKGVFVDLSGNDSVVMFASGPPGDIRVIIAEKDGRLTSWNTSALATDMTGGRYVLVPRPGRAPRLKRWLSKQKDLQTLAPPSRVGDGWPIVVEGSAPTPPALVYRLFQVAE